MSAAQSTAVGQFAQRFEEMKKEGLVDMKFFVGEVAESTQESFCREVNEIDRLVEEGKATPFSFGDCNGTK
jgi:hypothetical protein